MDELLVHRIKKLSNDIHCINDVLGMDKSEYRTALQKLKTELMEIVKTGRYSIASIKLLNWLGFKDEEIDLNKVLKGVAIINSFVTIINIAEKAKK